MNWSSTNTRKSDMLEKTGDLLLTPTGRIQIFRLLRRNKGFKHLNHGLYTRICMFYGDRMAFVFVSAVAFFSIALNLHKQILERG